MYYTESLFCTAEFKMKLKKKKSDSCEFLMAQCSFMLVLGYQNLMTALNMDLIFILLIQCEDLSDHLSRYLPSKKNKKNIQAKHDHIGVIY